MQVFTFPCPPHACMQVKEAHAVTICLPLPMHACRSRRPMQ